MKSLIKTIIIAFTTFSSLVMASQSQTMPGISSTPQLTQESTSKIDLKKPMYQPFIERFLIDEVLRLNKSQQQLEVKVIDKLASNKMEVTDRAIRLATDTVNNIFYTIAIGSSLVLLFGWKSINDIKTDTKLAVTKKIDSLTGEFEDRIASNKKS